MEYQKSLNQLFKFRTKNWVEINDDSSRTYNMKSQIKFKNLMLKSSLCDYCDAQIHFKGTVTLSKHRNSSSPKQYREKIILKNYAPFTDCISEINNKKVDNAQEIDITMPMYSLTEYSDNYSKTSGGSWQ